MPFVNLFHKFFRAYLYFSLRFRLILRINDLLPFLQSLQPWLIPGAFGFHDSVLEHLAPFLKQRPAVAHDLLFILKLSLYLAFIRPFIISFILLMKQHIGVVIVHSVELGLVIQQGHLALFIQERRWRWLGHIGLVSAVAEQGSEVIFTHTLHFLNPQQFIHSRLDLHLELGFDYFSLFVG